ncbi:hypothetical protein R1flu_029022 [Riccia fluitans]|uniref:Uncharacterized protein n=1 Tax=Riccia fluitans TaxID=41844 RepID=A0ABD1XNC0_9MARC
MARLLYLNHPQQTADGGISEFSQPGVCSQTFNFTFPVMRPEIDINEAAPPRKALNRRKVRGQNTRGMREVHGNVESSERNPESPADMYVDEIERDENESEGEEGGVGEVGKGRNTL